MDWGDSGRLLAISSPVLRFDAIDTLYRDGDRRRLEYTCAACGEPFPFAWDRVTGREKGEVPSIACSSCGVEHGEPERRKMLRTGRWVAQRDEPTDEDVISFSLSWLDSGRGTLDQVVREWRRARRAVERGDREGLKAFRNVVLGLPGEAGAVDVDRLYELRLRDRDVSAIEQVTAGVDVQDDRVVYVVIGFTPGNTDAHVLDFGVTLGDPRDGEVWAALASQLSVPFAGLPVSIVRVDAGFLTSDVRRECSRRRWWIPAVGRAGEGKPLAKRISAASGLATVGKDNAASWWSGRAASGNVHLPREITRPEIAEMCAAEALTATGGKLAWKRIEGRSNHLFDASLYAIHSRHFRPLTARRRAAYGW